MSTAAVPGGRPPRTARCWTLQGPEGTVDVQVTARDDECLADLLPLLGDTLGVPVSGLWTGDAHLDDRLPLSSPALRHGAVLGLDRPTGGSLRGASPLELRVVGGPDAGRCLPLAAGRHVLGRGQECDIRVADPDISRRHLELRLSEGTIEVRDLGSTNGTTLGDERLTGRFRPWPADERVHLGATAMTVTGRSATPAVGEPSAGGRTRMRRPHRLHVPRVESEIVLPSPPADAPRRRLAWVAVLLPAIGGGLLAWLLRTPTFLFFALLSPLMALGSWASDRWSGRRSSRRELASYRDALSAARQALDQAVRADVRAAEQEHPDPATIASAVRRRTADVWSRDPAAAGLTVRLGSGPGPSHVTRVEGDGARHREIADHLPATLDLAATGGVAVVGPRSHALGVLRAVLGQLTALHPPDGLALLLLTRPDRIGEWAWARWLPHLPADAVHVDADAHATRTGGDASLRAALAGLLAEAPGAAGRRVVIVLDRHLDPRTLALLAAARSTGVVLLATTERAGELSRGIDATLTLSGETGSTAVLARDRCTDCPGVLVDRVPADVAADLARRLAELVPADTATSLPSEVRLLDLPGGALRLDDDLCLTGRWPGDRDTLRACLGRSPDGTVEIDLCRDGPHALVAGTTGSGKSELLQALIAGLALNHPPELCSFLLIDYKGGAAFADAARLPHTVGLLTDLEGSTTARALRSLTAELSRREALLAAHRVPDIAALPASVDLARLVIVVDEFATLVDELPGFVPGLVGIAQRGRSLGIHLVLATQRPGGVVSPEIRANCSLRLCLRTTDEADARDVIGIPAAAHLPVNVPGRAFVRTGSSEARVFQVGRVAVPGGRDEAGPEVRRWAWPFPDRTARPALAEGPSDLVRLVDALSGLAAERGRVLPHRPWQPLLPDRLSGADLDHLAASGRPDTAPAATLSIGLVDRPDRQAYEPLLLDLTAGGGVLAVGGPRSGRTTLLRTVLREATARLGPDDLHVHVLDTGGGTLATEATVLPHTGTAIGGGDALRTVRLLDRLGSAIDARRAVPSDRRAPLVLVLVDGVEAVTSLLDECDPGRGSDTLLRLVRDGAAVGVTCVLTADRATPGGRLAAAARLRLVLPLPDRADYAVAGIPAAAVPAHRPPGRALLGEEARECQLVLPGPSTPRTDRDPAGSPSPVRIVELPAEPVLPARAGTGWQLTVGPGGDEGTPLAVDLQRGGGLLVLGPPRSGRTTALDAFARRLAADGVEIARLGRAPHGSSADVAGVRLDPGDLGAVRGWIGRLEGRRGALLADDLGPASEYGGLAALPPVGAGSGVVLLAAGASGQLAGHYQGPVAALRRARTGLLLCPGPADAEALGIRLPRMPVPVRPGSGWLVRDGATERVQVARVPDGSSAPVS